ncbi:MAG: family 16 glycoside hydrolase [Chloroflexaceae bacterium]
MNGSIRPAIAGAAVIILLIAALMAVTLWQAPRGVAQEQQPMLEYPSFPPTPTIGPNPTALAMPQTAAVLATDAFDDPATASAWTFLPLEPIRLAEQRPIWAIAGGRLEQRFTASAGNPSTLETAAVTGDPGWSDYTVQVSFYDLYNGTAGLVARYSGDDPLTASYYRYRILKNSYPATPKQVLERVRQGVATTLIEIREPGFDERMWHVLAMNVTDDTITVMLDGTIVVEAFDPQPLPAGRAGVYTRAMGGVLFDDFSVTSR